MFAAARKLREAGVLGLNERNAEASGATLFNSLLFIGRDGGILGRHRKLVPTYTERLVWGRGDGSSLNVVDTPVGKIGSLVCWEHWMPASRIATSLNVTTPVEVTPYSLWLIPTFLLDMIPFPRMYPRRFARPGLSVFSPDSAATSPSSRARSFASGSHSFARASASSGGSSSSTTRSGTGNVASDSARIAAGWNAGC